MIKLLNNTKVSFFEYFFVFCFLIYAGGATVFTREIGDIRTAGNAFAFIITLIPFLSGKIKLSQNYFKAIAVFLLYAFSTAIVYSNLNWWWISVNFLKLTYGYAICQLLGDKLFATVETILYHLSIISFPFWLILLISPDMLNTIVHTFEFSESPGEGATVLANMIIYTMPNLDYGLQQFTIFARNPGFAWEPGAFASMLCLGLYCNKLRTGFRFRHNRPFWIFVLALATTQSTTGFSIFGIMILLLLIEKKTLWPLFFLVPAVMYVMGLSFMGDKFEFELQRVQDIDSSLKGQQGRFVSFALDWEEFKHHPILGLGCNYQNTWLRQQGWEVSTVSGLGDLLSTYGLIITILFVYLLIKSAVTINLNFGIKDPWILVAVIIGTMISYGLWESPIYIAFWLYCVFHRNSHAIVR